MARDDVDDLKKGLRVGVWDIESTGLNGDYGYILCVCVLDAQTGVTYTVRIDDPRNPDKNSDKWVVKETVKLLNQFDLLAGWYTTKFDRVMLNTRAIKHHLKTPTVQYWRDLWYTSRFKLKLRSNSLMVVSEFLFGKTLKTRITPDFFNGAIRGEKKALDYVVKHCQLDVKETLRVYKRILPLVPKRLRKT